jgi:hypothetical protein
VPGNGQGNGPIVVAGAIGDYGKTTKEKNGIGKAALHKGTFEANLAAISKKRNNAKPTVANTTTCSFVFTAIAPVKLFNGTGMYKGISGTVMLTETFAGHESFYKTGTHMWSVPVYRMKGLSCEPCSGMKVGSCFRKQSSVAAERPSGPFAGSSTLPLRPQPLRCSRESSSRAADSG